MDVGASTFFTEYLISPTELGTMLEERGFESLWMGRALAHPGYATFQCADGRRARVAILRRDGPLCDIERGGGVDQAAKARHRGVPRDPA
jgi:hypothetical protein